jgi:hypothetical protein
VVQRRVSIDHIHPGKRQTGADEADRDSTRLCAADKSCRFIRKIDYNGKLIFLPPSSGSFRKIPLSPPNREEEPENDALAFHLRFLIYPKTVQDDERHT